MGSYLKVTLKIDGQVFKYKVRSVNEMTIGNMSKLLLRVYKKSLKGVVEQAEKIVRDG